MPARVFERNDLDRIAQSRKSATTTRPVLQCASIDAGKVSEVDYLCKDSYLTAIGVLHGVACYRHANSAHYTEQPAAPVLPRRLIP